MPRITPPGRRPACLDSAQGRNAVAQPHSATTFAPTEVDRKFGVSLFRLEIHRPCSTEARLRAQLQKIEKKAKPYTSTHGIRLVYLNGGVSVARDPQSGSPKRKVVCRHLATAFAQYPGKKSELLHAFSTQQGIADQFDGKWQEIEDQYERSYRNTPSACRSLVTGDQFGHYLQSLAAQLRHPGQHGEGPTQANCLLFTGNHAMALHIERKSKNGVDYFAAKLYDPNTTANYRRVVKATPESFAELTIREMMLLPRFVRNAYNGGGNKPLSMVAVSLDDRLQPNMGVERIVPSRRNMYSALAGGVPDAVRAMLDAAQNISSDQERFKLLQASFRHSRRYSAPGLFAALAFGHSEVVGAFTQAVLASKDLSAQAKADLLAAKNRDGTPGLNAAFQSGHSEVVSVFTQAVLASKDLSAQAKIDLLAAKTRDDRPGLFMAFVKGHSEVVGAFTQAVLASQDLSAQAKTDLLAAKEGYGTPGLFRALRNGYSEVVVVFTQAVLASEDLGTNAKIDLLTAKHRDGTPGLYAAFQSGHPEVFDAFTEAVSGSVHLDDSAKKRLLTIEV